MSFPIRLIGYLGIAASAPSSLVAQAATTGPTPPSAAIARAAETITEQDVRLKLGALAHDSTRGRETPSPELTRATEWVAVQFRNAGLEPGGDAGGYLQAFRLRHSRLDSLTAVTVAGPGYTARWALGREIVYAAGGAPVELRDAPVVLLAGVPADTARPFGDVPVRGAVILQIIAPDQLRGSVLNPLHRRAQAEGVLAHLVASDIPVDLWARLTRGFAERWDVIGNVERAGGGRLAVYGMQLATVGELLRAAGEDPAALTAPAGQGVRSLAAFTITVVPHFTTLEEPSVANVVGVLRGSDPMLRNEAVIFTSHLDHVGVIPGRCRPSRAMPADSICNGADDNASGTVGVIELAEAYATLTPRPARTLIFVAATAEERGLCGSRFYVEHPLVPLDRTAAVINLDMIARNPRDTVGFVGKDYTALGTIVDRALRDHPDLRLAPTEHQGVYQGSDHYPFAQQGVPALFLFSGEHPDLHTAADNPEGADAEQAARIVRLAFFVGLEVANGAERPAWDPAARASVVGR
jgi:hypothetical protein